MKISILGLGYVGCVGLACLARNGHQVIGVDVNPSKVEMINQGKSPIVEEGLDVLIRAQRAEGRISATTRVAEAIQSTEISFICVGTPSGPNGHTDTKTIFKVVEEIGFALKGKEAFHVVVLRSTVPPGTHERTLHLIESLSSKKRNKEFAVVSNPEFLREGTAVKDYYEPPYTLIASDSPIAIEKMREVYQGINAPFIVTDIGVAEMIKYVNNAFHALKITFANEIGMICKKLGIDSHKLMEIFCQDRKLNLSPYYLKPGFAYGGSCLPKDLKALNILAHDLYIETPIIANIEKSNELQKQRLLETIISLNKWNLGFLGLSFKAGTDDLRNSPVVDVIEQLIGKGYKIKIYDKNVRLATLMGANREFILQRIPLIAELLCEKPEDILSGCEVVVVVNKEEEFQNILAKMPQRTVILDLVNLDFSGRDTRDNYKGFAW